MACLWGRKVKSLLLVCYDWLWFTGTKLFSHHSWERASCFSYHSWWCRIVIFFVYVEPIEALSLKIGYLVIILRCWIELNALVWGWYSCLHTSYVLSVFHCKTFSAAVNIQWTESMIWSIITTSPLLGTVCVFFTAPVTVAPVCWYSKCTLCKSSPLLNLNGDMHFIGRIEGNIYPRNSTFTCFFTFGHSVSVWDGVRPARVKQGVL